LNSLDPQRTRSYVDRVWADHALPALLDYIRIPNRSPLFDPQWQEHGHMDRAVELIADWCRAHGPQGMALEVRRLPGRTPLIFMEIPGTGSGTILLYGHLDKQPEMTGWAEGLGPWTPVLKGDRLYGRGGADDGYSAFAAITALAALHEQGIPHARCVVLIEACEESGSPDLPHHLDALGDRLGPVDLVICLDSGCGNYDQLWLTTSLRGILTGDLRVEVLREGVHSGDAGGVVPETFRVVRQLLDRLDDPATGRIRPEALWVEIPPERIDQARAVGEVLGTRVHDRFPFLPGVRAMTTDPTEVVLNRTWRPSLAVTGQSGLPLLADAGNVLRPHTAVKLSLRLPPTLDADAALATVKSVLERDPPYGARVSFQGDAQGGWDAPPMSAWLGEAIHAASQRHFDRPAMLMGEGGSIPFMGMLGRKFPAAGFVITGVLGPESNAHGPNEFLHLPTARRLTACVADLIAAHHRKG
jgi:acetylornithine deacetylase/succinyl-diaminopimelate desuccinylase-like protein